MPSPEAALGRGHGHRLASQAHPPRAGGQQAAELLGSDFPPGTFPSLQRGRLASRLALRGKGGAIGSSDGEEERRRSKWGPVPMAGAPEGSGWARYEGAEQGEASEVLGRGTRRPAEPPLAGSHRGEMGSWSRKHGAERAALTEVRGLRTPAPAPPSCWSSLCIPPRGAGMIQLCMCLSLSKALAAEPPR